MFPNAGEIVVCLTNQLAYAAFVIDFRPAHLLLSNFVTLIYIH